MRKPVAAAESIADLHAALQPVIDAAATPDLVPAGAMVLQPSPARRRSGSHYTPRELTEPIVRTALEPILARLRGPGGEPPAHEAILDLKVCDPAMGSGPSSSRRVASSATRCSTRGAPTTRHPRWRRATTRSS